MEKCELEEKSVENFLLRESPATPSIAPLLDESSRKPLHWKERWFFPLLGAAVAFGLCIGLILSSNYPLIKEISKLRVELQSLSQKVSSFEEITQPEYELIEPLNPSATIQSSV